MKSTRNIAVLLISSLAQSFLQDTVIKYWQRTCMSFFFFKKIYTYILVHRLCIVI